MDDGVLLIILQKLPSLRSRIAAAMVTKGFLRVAFAPSNNTSTFACGYRMSKRGRRCCSQEPSLLSDTLPKLELWRCRKVKGLGLPGLRDGYRDFNFDMPIRQAAAAAISPLGVVCYWCLPSCSAGGTAGRCLARIPGPDDTEGQPASAKGHHHGRRRHRRDCGYTKEVLFGTKRVVFWVTGGRSGRETTTCAASRCVTRSLSRAAIRRWSDAAFWGPSQSARTASSR